MNKWISISIISVLAIGVFVAGAFYLQEVVTFPDANLEAAIRYSLGDYEGPIKRAHLESLDWLEAEGWGISDLTGLEYCLNLEELALEGNNISDISPLVANSGLSAGDRVFLMGNPLSSTSLTVYLPQL